MQHENNDQTAEVSKTLGVGKRRSLLSRIIRLIILIGLLGGIAAVAVTRLRNENTDTTRYTTQPVKRGDLLVTVSATGTLEPIKKVDVGIEVSGTIKKVDLDYNDVVKVGQVLAELDTSKLEAQMLQSDAALSVAKARLLQAQATVLEAKAQMGRLEEMRKLSNGKMPSQSEFDTQKATLARAMADEGSAKASVAQAQATLDANKSDLSKAVIHSPINGMVLTRSVEPGQTVAAMFQSPVLFTLAEDLTQMELQVDVDEADVGQVKEDQDATFTVDAYPDQVFSARTTQVRYGSQTVDGVVTYKAVLKVDNSNLALRPGMTATAAITVNKRANALLISNAALRFKPPQTQAQKKGGESLLFKILPHPPASQTTQHDDTDAKSKEQKVWVLSGGQLQPVTITKGLSDGKVTEVLTGELEPGMELVTFAEVPK